MTSTVFVVEYLLECWKLFGRFARADLQKCGANHVLEAASIVSNSHKPVTVGRIQLQGRQATYGNHAISKLHEQERRTGPTLCRTAMTTQSLHHSQ